MQFGVLAVLLFLFNTLATSDMFTRRSFITLSSHQHDYTSLCLYDLYSKLAPPEIFLVASQT